MFLCFFLIFTISFGLFSGCGKKPDNSAGADIDENGYLKGIKANGYVEMFNYKAIAIPNNIHNISDDTLQSEIDNLLADYSPKATDRAVKDGESVNIDYVGSIDGVKFEGGNTNGAGTDVTAGSTNYIDDFLTQIIGHMPGETINVEVTFPDDYHEESLQGKDAVFVTTINHINDPVVLTDKFVSENLTADYGWKTVAEMKTGMKSELKKAAIENYIRQYFITEVKIKSVPDRLIEYQEKSMIDYYQRSAENYGMELDALLSYYGFANTEELIEYYQDNTLEEAKYSLVIQAIAEDMKISLTETDLADYFIKYFGSGDYSSFVEQYGLPYIKHVIMNQNILDYIVENAILQ
jgi:trigger factor